MIFFRGVYKKKAHTQKSKGGSTTMMCNCNSHKGHNKCMQIGGVVLLLVGLVYVAQSLGWLSATLPNFWAVLLVLFGLFTVMEAKAAGA